MGRRCSHKRASFGPRTGGRCAARRRARGQGEISQLHVYQPILHAPRDQPQQQARAAAPATAPIPAAAPAPAAQHRAPPPPPPPSGPPPAYSAEPRKLSKTFWPLRGEEFDVVEPAPVKERGFLGGKKGGVSGGGGGGGSNKTQLKSREDDAGNSRFPQSGEEEEEALGAPPQPLSEFLPARPRRGFGRFVDAFRAAAHAWRRPPRGRAVA